MGVHLAGKSAPYVSGYLPILAPTLGVSSVMLTVFILAAIKTRVAALNPHADIDLVWIEGMTRERLANSVVVAPQH